MVIVITNKSNKVLNLTKRSISKKSIQDKLQLEDLGGLNQTIVVIGREGSSRDSWAICRELLGIEDQCQYAQKLNTTGAVLVKLLKLLDQSVIYSDVLG